MTHPGGDRPFDSVIVASNRGPVTFVRGAGGKLEPHRGTGGLVTALTGAMSQGGTWVAAALSDEDRAAARRAEGGIVVPPDEAAGTPSRVRYLTIPPKDFDGYYNYVSNGILWFVHHYLWETARAPIWRDDTRQAWQRYTTVNRSFAEALAEEAGRSRGTPAFLIQDYHLSLVPRFLRELMPDALIAHFSHTPMAGPTYIRVLPTEMRRSLLRGLLGADVLGFHSQAWSRNFLSSAQALPDARVDFRRSVVHVGGREILVRVHPMSIDVQPMRDLAATERIEGRRREVQALRGDGKLILRVDRMELTKNILRGFLAYETLLRREPPVAGRRPVPRDPEPLTDRAPRVPELHP